MIILCAQIYTKKLYTAVYVPYVLGNEIMIYFIRFNHQEIILKKHWIFVEYNS